MSNANSKGLDLGSLDFSLGTTKQEQPSAFTKKSSAQEGAYGPMDQLFAAQIPSPPVVSPPSQAPNINDFNTMQLMFKTNGFGDPQEFNFAQPQPVQPQAPKQPVQVPTQLPAQFTSTQQFQGNADDFSTSMMRMFQTTSTQQPQSAPLGQLNLNLTSTVQPTPPKQ